MQLADAKKFVMPFGKHKGKTLEQIGDDDPLYLDWLAGQRWREPLEGAVQQVAKAYSRDIEAASGDDD